MPSPDRPNSTPLASIIGAYEWKRGPACYRCGRDDVETACVGSLPQPDRAVCVSACPSCVAVLEREREAQAERFGWPYQPGPPVGCPDR